MFAASTAGDIVFSDLVKGELLEGAYLRSDTENHLRVLHGVFGSYLSHPFDARVADAYARTRAHLRLAGKPIGPIDTAIAATALVHRCTVVTHNRKHYDLVIGLAVEDWQAEEA